MPKTNKKTNEKHMLKNQTHILPKTSHFAILSTTIPKGVEKATPWTHTQFNNSRKGNQGQRIVHETLKYKLFRTCYKITWKPCKYSHSKSFLCHLWFRRCILSWPFKRISGHLYLLCMNCQAVSQIRTSIHC